MGILTKEQLCQPIKLATEEVPTPELGNGASVMVRELTGGEFDELRKQMRAAEDDQVSAVLLVAMSLCDQDGKRLFSGRAGLGVVAHWPVTLVIRLGQICDRLSRLSDVEEDGEGPLDETTSDPGTT